MNQSNGLSLKSAVNCKILLILLMLTLEIVAVKSNSTIKVFPLVDDILQKIYLLNFKSETYYLVVSCKENNMISLSIAK